MTRIPVALVAFIAFLCGPLAAQEGIELPQGTHQLMDGEGQQLVSTVDVDGEVLTTDGPGLPEGEWDWNGNEYELRDSEGGETLRFFEEGGEIHWEPSGGEGGDGGVVILPAN